MKSFLSPARRVLATFGLALWVASAVFAGTVAPRWSFTTLNTATAGAILSSPSVDAQGNVYFGIQIGTTTTATRGAVFSLRPDGTQRWRYDTADWVDASPAQDADGALYVGSWDGVLHSLNADGSLRWTRTLGGFISGSAAVGADGTVYVGCGDGNLYAFTRDGAEKWRAPTQDWIDSSPAVAADGTIYVGSWDKALHAFAPNGEEKWRHLTGGNVVSSPALGLDGTIYFGSRDHGLYAINPQGDLVWRVDVGASVEASPVLGSDGTVYIPTAEGRLFAIGADGREKWRYPAAGAAALAPLYSTPAVRSDGTVLFGTSEATLVALNTANGTLAWTQTLGDWVDSSPVVAMDGSVYVGCYDKKLYAYTGTAPAMLTDWPQARRDAHHSGRTVMGAAVGTTGRLFNLAVRATAGTGENTLISGFVVSGTGSRQLLVRGTGPTLASFGVTGTIADPQLTAYTGSTAVAQNDNWETGNVAETIRSLASRLGAFALPTGSRDATIYASFSSGAHSVHVSNRAATTGVALMEVYDGGGDAEARLANLSARTFAGQGAELLTIGFTITEQSRSLLIRGIGPTLGAFGVPNTLADPQLKLYRGTEVIAENDNWSDSGGTTLATLFASAGAFSLPSGARDSALVVTLPAGGYTATIAGAQGGTGIALVELYELR